MVIPFDKLYFKETRERFMALGREVVAVAAGLHIWEKHNINSIIKSDMETETPRNLLWGFKDVR